MKTWAVGIILHDEELLTIMRFNHGNHYSTLPGGGVERGETPVEACRRELVEEAGLDVADLTYALEFDNNGRQEVYFTGTTSSTRVTLGGPERDRQSDLNTYRLVWTPVRNLDEIDLKPVGIADHVKQVLRVRGAE